MALTHFAKVQRMDTVLIDQTYTRLQTQSQQTVQALQALGQKLQNAANAGDQQAREWLLDLRELALSFREEQAQVSDLLQALHSGLSEQTLPTQTDNTPSPGAFAPELRSGFLSSLMKSDFAHSIEAGAGFGIGNDVINKLL